MNYRIKELRKLTGLSQTEFSKAYRIPVSTLRKWEQGEATPSPYVISLLASAIPGREESFEKIVYDKDTIYYFDPERNNVSDRAGNTVLVRDDLSGVSRSNLRLYLHDLFEGFYGLRERFEDDCRFDRTEEIEWERNIKTG